MMICKSIHVKYGKKKKRIASYDMIYQYVRDNNHELIKIIKVNPMVKRCLFFMFGLGSVVVS